MAFNADTVLEIAQSWPGKSRPSVHPALWHMLDVGAVAQKLLKQQPVLGETGDQALAALIALHDLGKISTSFRAMLQDGHPQKWRHWQHTGDHLWRMDDLLADHLGGDQDTRRILVAAIAGHHGGPRPTETADRMAQQRREIGENACADAETALNMVLSLFPKADLPRLSFPEIKALSWQVNGLTVQSDWIGSNPNWFPPAPPDLSLHDYWARACAQANKALGLAQVTPTAISNGSAQKLLQGYSARPLQQAALDQPLPNGPCLAILEDSTGAGKTEAGLILALRMMQAQKARGLFFALPTMATANAMLPRLERAATHLFAEQPSLALSHGRARLSDPFRQIQARDGLNPEDGPHCGSWLAEDRRRVLLADMGVGTVDQALLGILPTRFNGLRLRALSQRILIVDEAHDYDPYMQRELEQLLQMQARMGGSAIVMTATLPGPKKAAFQAAFQRGLKPKLSRWGTKPQPSTDPSPYPALTMISDTAQLTAVNAAQSRRVQVARLGSDDEALAVITQAQSQGAACIWIRNAVDDAIGAVQSLRALGIMAELLHARFALCDRLDKEAPLLARFGPDGAADQRKGRVLVATQVAEQSLDVDFDVMVSDLAPMGALIQRAGRLWRHMAQRPHDQRPVPGPCLQVLAPDPAQVDNARWLHQVLDRGAYTYDVTQSWRAAQALFSAGEIAAPEGLRALIEACEGHSPLPLPEALHRAELEQSGAQQAERGMAGLAVIDSHDSFDQPGMAKVWDEEQFPTRLGVPQVTLALAVQTEQGLEPWAGQIRDGWAQSEVQIAQHRFDALEGFPNQLLPEIARIKEDWSEPRAKFTQIAPVGPDGQICEGLRYDRDLGLLIEH